MGIPAQRGRMILFAVMSAAGQSSVQSAGFTPEKGLMRKDERTAQIKSEMTFWPTEHLQAGEKPRELTWFYFLSCLRMSSGQKLHL